MVLEYECDGSCVENDQSNEYPQTILSGFQTTAFIRCTELTPRPKPQDDDESETIPKASGKPRMKSFTDKLKLLYIRFLLALTL